MFEAAPGVPRPRRAGFPPPWSVEKLDACFVARDHDGQQLTMSISKMGRGVDLTKDEARRIAANITKLPELAR